MGTQCAPKRKRERCSGPACTQCKTRPERTHAGYTPGVSPRLQALVSVQLTPMPPTPLTARCRLKTPSPTAPPAAWAAPLPSAASERCAYAAAAQGSGRVATARTSPEPRRQQSLLANGCSSFLRGDSQRGRRLRAAGLGAPSQPASSAAPPAAWVAPLRDHAILSAAPPAAWVAPLRNPQNSAAPPAAWVARARGKPL